VSNSGHFRNRHYERRIIATRLVIAGLFVVIGCVVLLLTVANLQVLNHSHFTTLSADNRLRVTPVPPTRGEIYDRNGNALAKNVETWKIEVVPEQVDDIEKTLADLSEYMELSDWVLGRFHSAWKRRGTGFRPIPLRLRLSEEEVARFSVNSHRFPGVNVVGYLSRYYPYGADTAHVVGYVSRLDKRNLQNVSAERYAGTTHIGKAGIERTYESILHGYPGERQIETNAIGRTVREVSTRPPTSGADLHLTLDIELQEVANDALGDRAGSIVAIDPRNGQVLAIVSKPYFDPNLFVHGIDHASFNRLNANNARPMFNRSLHGQYPPGSTIKPFVGLAGLHHGVITNKSRVHCGGSYTLPNSTHRYRDWKRSGHGNSDLDRAIVQSCDVYFYDLANKLGIDRLHDFLAQFGFGNATGIDLSSERKGLLPSAEWKRGEKKKSWYPGETLITGIGQGFMLSTPVQLATATASLASQGKLFQPYLLKYRVEPGSVPKTNHHPAPKRINVQARHYRSMQRMMERVTSSSRGTARSVGRDLSYLVAGKTGTSQVYGLSQNEDEDAVVSSDIPAHLVDHALFVAYAPAENPTIAIAVVVEHGGSGGAVAAPVARKVIHWHLYGELPPPIPRRRRH
jgi:penicillin-binding protein 2